TTQSPPSGGRERIEVRGFARLRDGLGELPERLQNRARIPPVYLGVSGVESERPLEIGARAFPIPTNARTQKSSRRVSLGEVRVQGHRFLSGLHGTLISLPDGGGALGDVRHPESRDREGRPGGRELGTGCKGL